jgi:hypothetical protein
MGVILVMFEVIEFPNVLYGFADACDLPGGL